MQFWEIQIGQEFRLTNHSNLKYSDYIWKKIEASGGLSPNAKYLAGSNVNIGDSCFFTDDPKYKSSFNFEVISERKD